VNILFQIIIANFLVSLLAFVGLIVLFIKEKNFKKILVHLVALSAGALIGGAFLHLLPEAVDEFKNQPIFGFFIFGFIIFFFIEQILHWHHCHKGDCPKHTLAYMNLVAESLHNFIDGLTIAASFVVNPSLGWTTTLVIALHEIPQELGDFGVLVYSGFDKRKALASNFLVALTAVLGGVFGFYLTRYVSCTAFLLPFTAGGFLYIAASDLIPEIKKETNTKKSLINFLIFVLGISLMYFLKFSLQG